MRQKSNGTVLSELFTTSHYFQWAINSHCKRSPFPNQIKTAFLQRIKQKEQSYIYIMAQVN